MNLRALHVRGFRCLTDVHVTFEAGITILVGENDAGKSSLLTCIDYALGTAEPTLTDVTHGETELSVVAAFDAMTVTRSWQTVESALKCESVLVELNDEFREQCTAQLKHDSFDPTTEPGRSSVIQLAQLFALTVRSNTDPINLAKRVLNKLEEPDAPVSGSVAQLVEVRSLDGRFFEDASQFFEGLFLTDMKRTVWHERLDDGTTIHDHVTRRISDHASAVSDQLNGGPALTHLQTFLPSLDQVRITTDTQYRDLQLKTRFLLVENGQEVEVSSKGDGTKRRVTMALLEMKRQEDATADRKSIYIFDEPDTHLHAGAQVDLFHTLRGFADAGHQVILTTHSPFLLNAVPANRVRLMRTRENISRVRRIADGDSEHVLAVLGIENAHLFFSRYLVIVEGQTEVAFLDAHVRARLGTSAQASLIKVISTEGVENVPGFAAAIAQLHSGPRAFVLHDSDAIDRVRPVIERLEIPQENAFTVGTMEFEDAFAGDVLERCWSSYVQSRGARLAPGWRGERIDRLKAACLTNGDKFSKKLPSLNAGGQPRMSKPTLGLALGMYAREGDLPEKLQDLCDRLVAAARHRSV